MVEEKPGEMVTVSAVLEKLRLRKRDNEFRMTPEGFTVGTGKSYKPEDLKIIRTYLLKANPIPLILPSYILLKPMMD